jgi:hypothetical protein
LFKAINMRSVKLLFYLSPVPVVLSILILSACGNGSQNNVNENNLSEEVKEECLRSWQAYKAYAWGHDVLKPLSKSYQDWYSELLYISPIDAYSTLKLMGFN